MSTPLTGLFRHGLYTPRNLSPWSLLCKDHGKGFLGVLIDQYAVNKTAQTLDGEEYEKKALVTTDICAEWTTFLNYVAKQPKQYWSGHVR